MKKTLFVLSLALAMLTSCAKYQDRTAEILGDVPQDCNPVVIGKKIALQFLSTSPEAYAPVGYSSTDRIGSGTYIHYAVMSTWVNSMEFADKTADDSLKTALTSMFDPFFNEKASICNRDNHVDFSVFGAIPLEVYLLTGNERCLEMGIHYADHQWSEPDSLRLGGNGNFDYQTQCQYLKDGYTPQTRLWIDDMYMITALQSQAFRATGDEKYLKRPAKEMLLYLDTIQNPDGLFYHAPDVPFVWGRGDGWMAAGMPMLLKFMPTSYPEYPVVLDAYRKMMATLLKYQREDGLWGQLVTDSESWTESSCSAMFTYSFIEGVKNGWLDKETYGPAAKKAWIALCGRLDQYGNISEVCVGTNRKNDREWYINRPRVNGDPHGQAAMMWICSALVDKK